jgi:DNA-binding transcriptional LysR family regulator
VHAIPLPAFLRGLHGGPKSVLPGVAGADSIMSNHSAGRIDDPLSRSGILRGNPIQEEIREASLTAGLRFVLNVILDEGNSENMARSVLEMENELALISQLNLDRKIKSLFFSTVEFVLVASPEHRFSGRKSISLRELNGEPVILREKGSGSRAAILRKFQEYGIWPSVIIEASSLDFIVGYVKQNKGVSFMFEPDIPIIGSHIRIMGDRKMKRIVVEYFSCIVCDCYRFHSRPRRISP